MTDVNETKEGVYGNWRWDAIWKSWLYETPHRIYPHEDGKFTVSSSNCWHDGIYDTFEEAEKEALGMNDDKTR